jgi:hypothetical protein
MSSYYILLLIVPVVFLVLFLVRKFSGKPKDSAVILFKAALKEENTGHFQAAIAQYELALQQAEKKGFDKSLIRMINEKLKVLHTINEYEKEMQVQSKMYQMKAAK